MSQNDEASYERACEAVERNPMDSLLKDRNAEEEFLLWMDAKYKDYLQLRLTEWMITTEGRAFYERAAEEYVRIWADADAPDGDGPED